MSISKQVKEMRDYANLAPISKNEENMILRAANTIETLFAKLAASNSGEWIACEDRLPEEKINPITQDFYEYQVTFQRGSVKDIRHCKFGDGHWWHCGGNMDNYIIAWQPLPEPYKPTEGGGRK